MTELPSVVDCAVVVGSVSRIGSFNPSASAECEPRIVSAAKHLLSFMVAFSTVEQRRLERASHCFKGYSFANSKATDDEASKDAPLLDLDRVDATQIQRLSGSSQNWTNSNKTM